MNVALITIYHVPNYGSILQAYATQRVLEKLGHECRIIFYCYPNEWHFKQGAKRQQWYRKLIKKIGLAPLHRKENKLNSFKVKYFNFTKKYRDFESLRNENWNNYDVFIVGSDQVWNPRFLKGDRAFLLSFVPKEKRRISIASSFAQSQIPMDLISRYKEELGKFYAISVREKNGVEIIKNQLNINKDVFVCLDPTLLLSRNDWKNEIQSVKRSNIKPYILIHMLNYAFDPQPYFWLTVKYFANKLNCRVVALAGYKHPNEAEGVVMLNKTDASISEFIDLFDKCEMVITSSFHGTAFALNFGKPLVSIMPKEKGDDRQSSLLNDIGATNSIVRIGDSIDNINPYYNKGIVLDKLNLLRDKSIEWIKNTLK